MPEIIRVRESRFRDDYSSDDERSSSYGRPRTGGYKTIQRYRVGPNRVEEVDDDRLTVRAERRELVLPRESREVEIDRRVERLERELERPRSALERPRSVFYEREYREPEREPERTRTIIYEREREPEPLRPWERERDRPWERERDIDVRLERRPREEPTMELEKYSRETEYYTRPEPPPQPIVIRQRVPEPQQIIIEAPRAPAPVVYADRYEDERQVARPAPRREEEDYYYRKDVREVERDDDRRSDHHDAYRDAAAGALVTGAAAYGINKYRNRNRRRDDSASDTDRSSGSEVIVRRERRVARSRSHSPHHKLHLAEGALAGAGAAAIIANHRRKSGTGGDHKAGKVISGAALGAIGAELVTRARSRYRDDSRGRSRSSSRHSHSKLKMGLGLAAAAVAAAAAGKYVSNRKAAKDEELGRGRSRHRSSSRHRSYSSGDEDEAEYKHLDPKHRKDTVAKAAAGGAVAAGIVEALRSRSRSRKGEKSRSRVRKGATIAATGLATAAIAGLYEKNKAKKEEAELKERERRASRSRSRARSRSLAYSDDGQDPELGMVEYGTNPVYTTTDQRTAYNQGYYPDPASADAAYGEPREGRSHSRSDRRSRSRSHSRARDLATGALATGAAAIGIDQYKKRKERKEAERERRRYKEEAPENYYADDSQDDGYSSTPPHASGGAYYPATNDFAPPPSGPPPAGGAPPHTTTTTHTDGYPPQAYNPADYADHPQANTYGYPPMPRSGKEGDNVSASDNPPSSAPEKRVSQSRDMHDDPIQDEEDRIVNRAHTPTTSNTISPMPSPIPSPMATPSQETPVKSVAFAPLSPTSSRRLARTRQRRSSDPSSDRPNVPSEHRRRNQRGSRSPSPDVEVLPDRFDADGRPLDGPPYGKDYEMVERVVRDFEDALDGRSSWKTLLRGIFVPPVEYSSSARRGR